MDDVLNDYGIQTTPVSSKHLSTPGLYLIMYWNDPNNLLEGAHFAVIKFDGMQYTTLNGEDSHTNTYSNRYIYGYRIN